MVSELALFPLHTVLFPGGALPLHVFEARYRALLEEEREFGVVLIREGREVGWSEIDMHTVGTLATVERRDRLPDGRSWLLCRGGRRFRILEVDPQTRPYPVAWVEWLVPDPEPAQPGTAGRLSDYLAELGVEVEVKNSPEFVERAVWLVGSLLQVEAPKLQPLLESGSASMAKAMVEEELMRLRSVGKVSAFRPRVISLN